MISIVLWMCSNCCSMFVSFRLFATVFFCFVFVLQLVHKWYSNRLFTCVGGGGLKTSTMLWFLTRFVLVSSFSLFFHFSDKKEIWIFRLFCNANVGHTGLEMCNWYSLVVFMSGRLACVYLNDLRLNDVEMDDSHLIYTKWSSSKTVRNSNCQYIETVWRAFQACDTNANGWR